MSNFQRECFRRGQTLRDSSSFIFSPISCFISQSQKCTANSRVLRCTQFTQFSDQTHLSFVFIRKGLDSINLVLNFDSYSYCTFYPLSFFVFFFSINLTSSAIINTCIEDSFKIKGAYWPDTHRSSFFPLWGLCESQQITHLFSSCTFQSWIVFSEDFEHLPSVYIIVKFFMKWET